MSRYSAVLLVFSLAILFTAIHFGFEYQAAIQDANTHNVPFVFNEFLVEWIRATFENLQSEMWQLALQFALLAGMFKFMNIHAYEEDNNDLKKRVTRIERKQNDVSNM